MHYPTIAEASHGLSLTPSVSFKYTLTAFHSPHMQTPTSPITSHSSRVTTYKHRNTLRHTCTHRKKPTNKALQLCFFPLFVNSLLLSVLTLLSLSPPSPCIYFLPLFLLQCVFPLHVPLPLFLSWHVRLYLRNTCECMADLYNISKNHPPSEAPRGSCTTLAFTTCLQSQTRVCGESSMHYVLSSHHS